MSLREGLDQGVPLPSAPPPSPAGWTLPLETPPPRLPQSGPQRPTPRYRSVRATRSGQRCRPSRHLERLKRAAITDFLEMEAEQGTAVASRILGEELAFYRIAVFHNSLDCLNCSPW